MLNKSFGFSDYCFVNSFYNFSQYDLQAELNNCILWRMIILFIWIHIVPMGVYTVNLFAKYFSEVYNNMDTAVLDYKFKNFCLNEFKICLRNVFHSIESLKPTLSNSPGGFTLPKSIPLVIQLSLTQTLFPNCWKDSLYLFIIQRIKKMFPIIVVCVFSP